jgi:predicted unusual protein kinase regulating ubiquinone biosynthesis (AarF/ABC1/UbiB family)
MNLSSSQVLTMEYVPGIKITDVEALEKAGFDRKLLANRLGQSYLMQLCQHGRLMYWLLLLCMLYLYDIDSIY